MIEVDVQHRLVAQFAVDHLLLETDQEGTTRDHRRQVGLHPGDEMQELRGLAAIGVGEDVAGGPHVDHRLVDMHGAARLALDRLGHEAGGDSVPSRGHAHDALEHDEIVGGAQHVLALVHRIGDVVETAALAGMVFRVGDVVGLVVDREPAAAEPAIVELDQFGDPRAKAGLHELPEFTDVIGEEVEMVEAAGRGATSMIALGKVLERRPFCRGGDVAFRIPVDLEDMAEGILEAEGPAMSGIALDPAQNLEPTVLDDLHTSHQRFLG